MRLLPENPRLPLSLKIAFTAFMAVMVPFYWRTYGPTNFLYFCDVAMFMTLAAVWTERPLLAAMPAVGIVLPQMLWCADLLGTAIGKPLIGMTAYMFDDHIPRVARGISMFHAWLPFLLLYLVRKLGYDRRALVAWTVLAWTLITISYLFIPGPPALAAAPNTPVNVNYVYGLSDAAPQGFMRELAWLALLVTALPLAIFAPTHLFLRRFARAAA